MTKNKPLLRHAFQRLSQLHDTVRQLGELTRSCYVQYTHNLNQTTVAAGLREKAEAALLYLMRADDGAEIPDYVLRAIDWVDPDQLGLGLCESCNGSGCVSCGYSGVEETRRRPTPQEQR